MRRIKGSRASVCDWNLTFSFLLKEQCEEFINVYLKEPIPLDFSYREELTNTSTVFIVDVEGKWASNLTRVAKLLEIVDHGEEDGE